jgi:hypothetical protein
MERFEVVMKMVQHKKLQKLQDEGGGLDLLFSEYMFDAIDTDDFSWEDTFEAGLKSAKEAEKLGVNPFYVQVDYMIFIFVMSKKDEAELVNEAKAFTKE